MGVSQCSGCCGVPPQVPCPHILFKTETFAPQLLEMLEAKSSCLSLSLRLGLSGRELPSPRSLLLPGLSWVELEWTYVVLGVKTIIVGAGQQRVSETAPATDSSH